MDSSIRTINTAVSLMTLHKVSAPQFCIMKFLKLMCYHDFQYVALMPKVELFEEEELIADGKTSLENLELQHQRIFI